MELLDCGSITAAAGLEGDYRGAKYPRRQITVLAVEDWSAALAVLAQRTLAVDTQPVPTDLDWTERRANLLVKGLSLPGGRGSLLQIGAVLLEVTGETTPCARMDEVVSGLRRALASGRYGGVTCRVVTGGEVALGDRAFVVLGLKNRVPRLPG
jgi:MOSC domain-containing protein YiiM